MSTIDWNSSSHVSNDGGSKVSADGKSSGKNKFLKFESGKTYNVRPIGGGEEFYKFFVNKRSICVDLEHKDAASKKLSAHFGTEIKPQLKFAMNIIDRQDNQVKVMEFGLSIYKVISQWAMAAKQHPGGKNGQDWMITVTGDGQNRRYGAIPIKASPLTDEEKARFEGGKGVFNLKEIYKAVPVDDVVNIANGRNNTKNDEQEDAAELSMVGKSAPAKGASLDDDSLW